MTAGQRMKATSVSNKFTHNELNGRRGHIGKPVPQQRASCDAFDSMQHQQNEWRHLAQFIDGHPPFFSTLTPHLGHGRTPARNR